VDAIVFKNIKMNGTAIKNADQLAKAGYDISVPVKFQ
jgi:hypothetical protein